MYAFATLLAAITTAHVANMPVVTSVCSTYPTAGDSKSIYRRTPGGKYLDESRVSLRFREVLSAHISSRVYFNAVILSDDRLVI